MGTGLNELKFFETNNFQPPPYKPNSAHTSIRIFRHRIPRHTPLNAIISTTSLPAQQSFLTRPSTLKASPDGRMET